MEKISIKSSHWGEYMHEHHILDQIQKPFDDILTLDHRSKHSVLGSPNSTFFLLMQQLVLTGIFLFSLFHYFSGAGSDRQGVSNVLQNIRNSDQLFKCNKLVVSSEAYPLIITQWAGNMV